MNAVVLAIALAATPIRLEEVRAESWKNVAALQAEIDRLRADQQVIASRGALLPQLTLGASGQYTVQGPRHYIVPVTLTDANNNIVGVAYQDQPIPTATYPAFDLNLVLQQSIVDASRWAQLVQNAALAEAAQGQELEQRMTSALEGVRRFYQLFRAQKTLEVLLARVQSSESQVARAKALFEAGKRRKDDALAAEVNLGNDRIAVAQQRSTVATADADLATWLARPGESELTAVEPAVLSQPPDAKVDLEATAQAARENRPLFKALAGQIRAAEAGINAQRAGYLPRVGLNITYDRNANDPRPFFADPRFQNTLIGTVNLNWNLFQGFSNQAQVRDQQYAKTRVQLQLEQTERELVGEIAKAVRALASQVEVARLAATNRDVAAMGLRLAQERFAAGAATTLEVRDAQQKLTDAELTALNGRIDVEIARAQLERDMGTLSPGVTP